MNVPVEGPADETGDGSDDQQVRPRVDRALLDRIFGQILPETTADERDPDRSQGRRDRSWYDENRPPHHDR